MKNIKIQALTDAAICTALSVIFVLLGTYVPIFAFASMIIAGMPLAYLGVKRGTKISGEAFLASALLIFVLTGNIIATVFSAIINLLPGIVCGYLIPRKKSFYFSVCLVSFAVLLGLMGELVWINMIDGGNGIENIISSSVDNIKNIFKSVVPNLQEQGASGEFFANIEGMLDHVKELIILYLPTMIIGFSVVVGYIIYMFSIFIMGRLRVRRIRYIPFNKMSAPRGLCHSAILLYMLASLSEEITIYSASLLNVVSLSYAMIGICGMSFIDFKLSSKIQSGYIRGAIYCFAFMVLYIAIGFVANILVILGLVDGLFNLRMLSNKVGERK